MQTFTLTVEAGIASLIDNEEPNEMPLAEGYGTTNDEAVADLFRIVARTLTFDG